MPHALKESRRSVTSPLTGGGASSFNQLLNRWVFSCEAASHAHSDLYSGCRKILRPWRMSFPNLDDSLQLSDCGFTTSKLRMLERNYVVPESIAAAQHLWDKRVAQGKYGSVGFSTYGHYVKGGGLRNPWELASTKTGRAPRPGGTMGGRGPSLPPAKVNRSSVMGPCIQSVMITLIDKKTYALDVPYRTTELYKKFPADLVFLRDVLLKPFDFTGLTLASLTCHFANVTVHPMYWVTIAPHLPDPVQSLKSIKDDYFRSWLIKWTARYVCPEYSRGIQKFAQALRVRKDALERLDKHKLRALQHYLRKAHPGHRNDYEDEEDAD